MLKIYVTLRVEDGAFQRKQNWISRLRPCATSKDYYLKIITIGRPSVGNDNTGFGSEKRRIWGHLPCKWNNLQRNLKTRYYKFPFYVRNLFRPLDTVQFCGKCFNTFTFLNASFHNILSIPSYDMGSLYINYTYTKIHSVGHITHFYIYTYTINLNWYL